MSRQKILLIVHSYSEQVGTIAEHIEALEFGLEADVVKVDCGLAGKLNIDLYDVIILHYSLVITLENYISDELREKISVFKGLTILFIQDEYRWVNKTANALRDLNVNVVFSLLSSDTVRKVYHHPWCDNIRFEHTLTGFVSEELAQRDVPNYEDRAIDVVYRARKLSAWYGYHTLQKWQIAEKFLRDIKPYDLTVDISTREEDRMYGIDWVEFMMGARAALGTESGASVCDFTGEIQANVEAYLEKNPTATYEELRSLFFQEEDGDIVMNVISPRCFEAASLRVLMIMYPGEYGGILKPGRHYVVLEEDHGNIEEVVSIIRDPSRAKKIIQTTYDEIVASGRWSYSSFSAHVGRVIKEETGDARITSATHIEIRRDLRNVKRLQECRKKGNKISRALSVLQKVGNKPQDDSPCRSEAAMKVLRWISERPGKIQDLLQIILPESLYQFVRPFLGGLYRFCLRVTRKLRW